MLEIICQRLECRTLCTIYTCTFFSWGSLRLRKEGALLSVHVVIPWLKFVSSSKFYIQYMQCIKRRPYFFLFSNSKINPNCIIIPKNGAHVCNLQQCAYKMYVLQSSQHMYITWVYGYVTQFHLFNNVSMYVSK